MSTRTAQHSVWAVVVYSLAGSHPLVPLVIETDSAPRVAQQQQQVVSPRETTEKAIASTHRHLHSILLYTPNPYFSTHLPLTALHARWFPEAVSATSKHSAPSSIEKQVATLPSITRLYSTRPPCTPTPPWPSCRSSGSTAHLASPLDTLP